LGIEAYAMQLERLEIGDDLHYPIRLQDIEPEFSSLLQKGRINVQEKAKFQPLNWASKSTLQMAATEGGLALLLPS
jgi:hypothetical protein